jgi:ABC-2 type transport system permease protein
MNLSRVKAVVVKDLSELRANRMAMVPMIVVPLVLCVVVPATVTFFALRLDIALVNGAGLIEKLLPAYTIPAVFDTVATRVVYVFVNYLFVPLFMLVPIMVSSIISANSVVGEKERHTLETLLYSPLSNLEFVVAKGLAAFVPALAITVVGFAGYFVAVNLVSYLAVGTMMVRSLLWIPAILLVSPAVSLLALCVTLLVSMRAKSFMEAQQMAAIVVIPFILFVVMQFIGLFALSATIVVLFGVAILGLDGLLLAKVGPRFDRETIVKTL